MGPGMGFEKDSGKVAVALQLYDAGDLCCRKGGFNPPLLTT